jgi:hypothetical protein
MKSASQSPPEKKVIVQGGVLPVKLASLGSDAFFLALSERS